MMDEMTDDAGAPIIEGLNAKVGILERRRSYLRRKLRRSDYAQTSGAEFDRHEIDAINAAVRALRYHAATLRPELDPVVHLARLTDALHNRRDPMEVARLTREARKALQEADLL